MYSHFMCIDSTDIDIKEKSFFSFVKMSLFKELNENDKKIFEKLKKDKNKTKNKKKNIIFDNSQKYALLIIKNKKRPIEFLIDFSMVVKLEKKFISILNTYEKVYDLDNKIFKKISKFYNENLKEDFCKTSIDLV